MSTEVQVHEFSFFEFCLKTQELILKGYRFSDTNENFPQAFSGSYSCKMVKEAQQSSQNLTEEETVASNAEEVKVVTKGRKPKAN